MRKTARIAGYVLTIAALALPLSPAAPSSADQADRRIALFLQPAIDESDLARRSFDFGGGDAEMRRQMRSAGCATRIPRARKDRPDVVKGRQIHVVHIMPSGTIETPDMGFDTKGIIACSVHALNRWMIEQTGGKGWNFDTFRMHSKGTKKPRLEIDVTYLKSERTSLDLITAVQIQEELVRRGFDDPKKRYLAYVFQTAPPCADAIYPTEPGFPPTWKDGQYANINFLSNRCPGGVGRFGVPGKATANEAAVLQALAQTDGVVGLGAPHGCPTDQGHVCTPGLSASGPTAELDPERTDLMHLPWTTLPLEDRVLDIGRDDYFRHPWEHLLDLEDSPYLVDLRQKKS